MTVEVRTPSREDLERVFQDKYGATESLDWGPRTRKFFRYFSPDDWYESVVKGLVSADTRWLEIGCGRDIFPSNKPLARKLSDHCALLVGVDPDETVHENPFLHESYHLPVEEFEYETPFDLITLRMVAEHIQNPVDVIRKLALSSHTGTRLVIYTVNKYSPVPLITNLTPFRARHFAKKLLWRTEEKDTFPTAYKMNSRRELNVLMNDGGFQEELFLKLDDCRSLARWRVTLSLELALRTLLNTVRISYPEFCLLGVYRKI